MASKAARSSRTPPIAELEVVRLRKAAETENGMMPAGAEGAVVYIHCQGEALEVEFEKPFHVVATLTASVVERTPA